MACRVVGFVDDGVFACAGECVSAKRDNAKDYINVSTIAATLPHAVFD